MAPFKRIRQPKMTTQALLSLDLGESSSSDSDFRIEDHNEEEDDFSDLSKDDYGADTSTNSDADSLDNASNNNLHIGTANEAGVGSGDSTRDCTSATQQKSICELESILKTFENSRKSLKIDKLPTKPICCVCLGDRSDDTNEIIECDDCGVSVHEGCYGVSENASISSTNSTCSTEPWFCEACRAGIKDPMCELCPNRGGIFKETDVGKWVHLVCALYIRGVAFGEVDQLASVTLFEMPYSKWGAKVCSLCENAHFARTGVCIECDAGMCKQYFHVTCAQAAGFLTEGQNEDEALDPYYAHCKVHSDKDMLKSRKRNYHMLRLSMEQKSATLMSRKLNGETCTAQERNKRKLLKYQQRYQKHKQLKGTPWVPTQKMSRMLTSSASACKRLLSKAAVMAVDVMLIERQESQIAALTDIRKKWHIAPAFSVEFIGYYLDRISRSKEIKEEVHNMLKHNMQLNQQQLTLRQEYDKHLERNKTLKSTNEALIAEITQLHSKILQLDPSKNLINPTQIGHEAVIAAQTTAQEQEQAKANMPTGRAITVPTAAALKMGVGFPLSQLGNNSTRLLSTYNKNANIQRPIGNNIVGSVASNAPPALSHDCNTCKRTNDQHLMAKCDTCKQFYHLDCLNPPLTRQPKKSKLYGWQCSECDKSDESEVVPQIPKGPRKSRTRFNKDGSILLMDSNKSDIGIIEKDMVNEVSINSKTSAAEITNDIPVTAVTEQASTVQPLKPVEALEKVVLPNTETNSLTVANDPLPVQPIVPTETEPAIALETTTLKTNAEHNKIMRKQKRKEKHRNKHIVSSDASDKSPNKEHKRKRKKKQHEHTFYATQSIECSETPNNSIPKIKIKFKTLPLPGEVTPEAQFFYVPADAVRSAEEASRPTSVETIEEPTPIQNSTFILPEQQMEVAATMQDIETSLPAKTAKAAIKGVRRKRAHKRGPQKNKKMLMQQVLQQSPQQQQQQQLKQQRASILLTCCVCSAESATSSMVTCDECRKHYHFTCLEPPLKKSPKIRGYSWHCADCDPTEEER